MMKLKEAENEKKWTVLTVEESEQRGPLRGQCCSISL